MVLLCKFFYVIYFWAYFLLFVPPAFDFDVVFFCATFFDAAFLGAAFLTAAFFINALRGGDFCVEPFLSVPELLFFADLLADLLLPDSASRFMSPTASL